MSQGKVAPPKVKRPPASKVGSGLKELLLERGFTVQEDPAVGLSFQFEGGTYYVTPQGDDPQFYQLLFPNFWELESAEETGRALFACDAVNREAKLVKLHTVEGDVWAGVESLHETPAQFVRFLPRYLGFVQEAVRAFRDVMLAVQETPEA